MCNAQLFQGDCFEIMRQLEPASIDAIITDPPYGTTNLEWDQAIDLDLFWKEAHRVVKQNGVIVAFSQQPFTTDLINSNRRNFRYEITWRKNAPVGFLDAKIRPLRIHENMLIFCQKFRGKKNSLQSTYNPQFTQGKPYRRKLTVGKRMAHYGGFGSRAEIENNGFRYPVDVLEFPKDRLKLHPTQKPLALMDWLVSTYTQPGFVVLDPFMGSGSTGVACAGLGRKFIGIELMPNYMKICRMRIPKVVMRYHQDHV